MMISNQQPRERLGFATLLCLMLGLIASQDSHYTNVVALHSELVDDQDAFFSQDFTDESDKSIFWLVHEARMLKGGRSGGRSRRSTGNCYGDRCDNIGGDAESAIIVGVVIGGCCLCGLCYALITWITGKRKESKKANKRKKRRGHDGEMNNEPIVIHAEEVD